MSIGAVVCRAVLVSIGLQTFHCPTCGGDRGFLLEHYEWYGWNQTCLSCGEVWQDGEMAERPFERAWRTKNIQAGLGRIEAALAPKEEKTPYTHQYTAEDCPGRPCGDGCDHRGLPPKETK